MSKRLEGFEWGDDDEADTTQPPSLPPLIVQTERNRPQSPRPTGADSASLDLAYSLRDTVRTQARIPIPPPSDADVYMFEEPRSSPFSQTCIWLCGVPIIMLALCIKTLPCVNWPKDNNDGGNDGRPRKPPLCGPNMYLYTSIVLWLFGVILIVYGCNERAKYGMWHLMSGFSLVPYILLTLAHAITVRYNPYSDSSLDDMRNSPNADLYVKNGVCCKPKDMAVARNAIIIVLLLGAWAVAVMCMIDKPESPFSVVAEKEESTTAKRDDGNYDDTSTTTTLSPDQIAAIILKELAIWNELFWILAISTISGTVSILCNILWRIQSEIEVVNIMEQNLIV